MENHTKKQLIKLLLEAKADLETALSNLNIIKQDFKELKMLYNNLQAENKTLKTQIESNAIIVDNVIKEKDKANKIAKSFAFALQELIGE